MRKVILYIAMSLDGYIADKQGGVAWLNGQEKEGEKYDSYSEFIKDMDTVILGWNTYHQIVTELSPKKWVYADLKSYVITHKKGLSKENIVFTERAPSEIIKQLKKEQGKGIWICGGASIAQQLMQDDLIDEYYISVMPTILGSGIRLFDKESIEIQLKLIDTHEVNGMIDLIYKRRS